MQNRDGFAHITYFDVPTQSSFVWDGKSSYIEVSIGGYAEPVDHMIDATDLWTPVNEEYPSAEALLRRFEYVCFNHAHGLPVYGIPNPNSKAIRDLVANGPAIGETRL